MVFIIVLILFFIVVSVSILLLKSKKNKYYFDSFVKMEEKYDSGLVRRLYTKKQVIDRRTDAVVSECIHGEEKFFYPSGSVNRINLWENGIKNGSFVVYYEDGNVYIQGTYKRGKFSGAYNVFDKQHNIIWSKNYHIWDFLIH